MKYLVAEFGKVAKTCFIVTLCGLVGLIVVFILQCIFPDAELVCRSITCILGIISVFFLGLFTAFVSARNEIKEKLSE